MNYTNLVNKWDDEEDLIEDVIDTTEPRETKFKWDEDEGEDQTTGIQCATCGADLTANKTGRPKKFCDVRCKNAHFNKKKTFNIVNAHVRLNNTYGSLPNSRAKISFIKKLIERYKQTVVQGYADTEQNKGCLTFAQCEALTNMFLFGPLNKKYHKFVDNNGKEHVNIAVFFMGHCFGHGIDPYDKEAIKKEYAASTNNGGNV